MNHVAGSQQNLFRIMILGSETWVHSVSAKQYVYDFVEVIKHCLIQQTF